MSSRCCSELGTEPRSTTLFMASMRPSTDATLAALAARAVSPGIWAVHLRRCVDGRGSRQMPTDRAFDPRGTGPAALGPATAPAPTRRRLRAPRPATAGHWSPRQTRASSAPINGDGTPLVVDEVPQPATPGDFVFHRSIATPQCRLIAVQLDGCAGRRRDAIAGCGRHSAIRGWVGDRAEIAVAGRG